MADKKITLTIAEKDQVEYLNNYLYVHKNEETKDDPNWVNPGDGSQANQVAKYTDEEWMDEHIKRYVASQIERGNNAKYRDAQTSFNATITTKEAV